MQSNFNAIKQKSVVSEKTPKIKYQKKFKDKQSHFQMLKGSAELSEYILNLKKCIVKKENCSLFQAQEIRKFQIF